MADTPEAVIAEAEKLLNELDSLQMVEFCYCGAAKGSHRFYNDKIYDVQGLTCPGGWGEFRYDVQRSKAEFNHRRALCIDSMLQRLRAELDALRKDNARLSTLVQEVSKVAGIEKSCAAKAEAERDALQREVERLRRKELYGRFS